MTRRGKCDTCRARKVKCDEERPKCSKCREKGRPCGYETATGSSSVIHPRPTNSAETAVETTGLQVVTSVAAPSGKGTFQKFSSGWNGRSRQGVMVGPGNVSTPLTSSDTELAARWVWTIDRYEAQKSPLLVYGGLVKLVPTLLGRSRSLDLAARYFLDSLLAHRTHKEEDVVAQQYSQSRALLSFRKDLTRPKSEILLGDAFWVTILHYAAAPFQGMGNYQYTIHLHAFARLASGFQRKAHDYLGKSIVTSVYNDEMVTCLGTGKESAFDIGTASNTYDRTAAGHASDHDAAMTLVMQQSVRIPRLAKWVRAFQKSAISREETFALALSMYREDPRDIVEKALAGSTHLNTNTSHDPIERSAIPAHIDFVSLSAFVLHMDYHSYKTLLCGLLMTLIRLGLPLRQTDLVSIQDDDITSATAIMAATVFASTNDPVLRLADLRILAPLQFAYGSWNRRRLRLLAQHAEDTDAYRTALHLRQSCLDHINLRMLQWGWSSQFSLVELDQLTDACAGAPLYTWQVASRDVQYD